MYPKLLTLCVYLSVCDCLLTHHMQCYAAPPLLNYCTFLIIEIPVVIFSILKALVVRDQSSKILES